MSTRDDGRTAREFRAFRRALARVRRVAVPGFADNPITEVLAAGSVNGVLWCVRRSPLARLSHELAHLSPDARRLLARGEGNGYARIPPRHPWRPILGRTEVYTIFGAPSRPVHRYDDVPAVMHGGATYGDSAGWIGFDTGHYLDTPERWPVWRVAAEARDVARQIARAAR